MRPSHNESEVQLLITTPVQLSIAQIVKQASVVARGLKLSKKGGGVSHGKKPFLLGKPHLPS